MKTIAINGSNGFIGKALCNYLSRSFFIIKIERSDYLIDPSLLAVKIETANIIINLAGSSIASYWTKKTRNEILFSRIETTRNLVNAVRLLKTKPDLFISASAIGIYDSFGEHNEMSTDFDDGFLAKVCSLWEKEAFRVSELGVPLTIVRIGLVLGNGGGLLPKMIIPFKFGLGTIFGDGQQTLSCIHIVDFVRAIDFIIVNQLTGIINLVNPDVITSREFSKYIALLFDRPLYFSLSKGLLVKVLGEQSSLLLDSKRVIPQVLLNHGFKYKFPKTLKVLENLIENR